jgi:hypothetical protein
MVRDEDIDLAGQERGEAVLGRERDELHLASDY